jgi:hypothetical protein
MSKDINARYRDQPVDLIRPAVSNHDRMSCDLSAVEYLKSNRSGRFLKGENKTAGRWRAVSLGLDFDQLCHSRTALLALRLIGTLRFLSIWSGSDAPAHRCWSGHRKKSPVRGSSFVIGS